MTVLEEKILIAVLPFIGGIFAQIGFLYYKLRIKRKSYLLKQVGVFQKEMITIENELLSAAEHNEINRPVFYLLRMNELWNNLIVPCEIFKKITTDDGQFILKSSKGYSKKTQNHLICIFNEVEQMIADANKDDIDSMTCFLVAKAISSMTSNFALAFTNIPYSPNPTYEKIKETNKKQNG